MATISEFYVTQLLQWADKNPEFFISVIDGMAGGIEGQVFLDKTQKEALQAKYEELTS